ncbi:MAG: type II toxin-antitoxin system VapC family toxin [Armatimonadota bacterium]
MNVFVDTSAFYAAISRSDINNEKSISEWDRLLDDESIKLYTSNYVVVESCALVRNRLGYDALRSFLDDLLPSVAILWVDQKVHASALEAMIAFGNNGPSLVDCSSFTVMRANGIIHALAFDKHFIDQGFSL